MRKVLRQLLAALRWIVYVLCFLMGLMNMPSVLGATWLFAALFLTPRQIEKMLREYPRVRYIFLFGTYVYLHFLTREDIRLGAENTAYRIMWLWNHLRAVVDFVS